MRPPGPRDRFFGLGTLRRFQRDLLGWYVEVHERYGDLVAARFGPYLYHAVFDPDLIREVLVTKAKSFRMNPPVRRVLAQWNGNGLITSEGEHWLRQRRLLQPAFSPRRFDRYAEAMVDRAGNLAGRWREELERGSPLTLDVDRAMTDLTLEIIARTLFGADISAEAAEIGRAVAILSEVAVREMQAPLLTPDWLPLPGKRRKRWAMRRLDATVRRFIRERRASGRDEGDLLSMLLLAVDEEGDGGGMTDEQARDECMTLFLAGHDTTAAGLTWTLYNIAREPEVARRLAAEVDSVLAGRRPGYSDVPRLAYTGRVVKESLRLYPPAIGVFARQAVSDVELGNYNIPRGSIVQPISFVVHRDPRWFPEPEKFDPDRFAPERVEGLPQFAYFPFGGGPRVCIGNSFATTEMVLVVATLAQDLTFALPPGQPAPELLPHMSLRPKGGLPLVIGTRDPASTPDARQPHGAPHG